MKPEEALKQFDEWNESGWSKSETPNTESLILAMVSLEKQIAQRPDGISVSHDGRLGNCPNCTKLVYERVNKNGCHECLQRITWGNKE